MTPSTPIAVSAVLFDFGMVLSGPPLPQAWLRMQQVTGTEESTFALAYWAERHAYDRGDHTGAGYWHAVGHHAGVALSDDQVAELIAADTELWTQPNQPIIAWALRLQAAGIRTGILSNMGDAMAAGVLATFDWLRHFDPCIWSYSLHLAKPEPAIYLYAIEHMHTAPEEILFIDDRAENIAAALAVGMQAIQFATANELEQELATRGLGWLWTAARAG